MSEYVQWVSDWFSKTQNYTSDTESLLNINCELNGEIKLFVMDEQLVQRVCSRTGWMNETVSVKQGEYISL